MSYVNPINKSLCLQILYEENYARLLNTLPFLRQPENTPKTFYKNIHTELLEKCRYTLTIKLQSLGDHNNVIGPSITCRIYLDTRSVEVLNIDGFTPVLTRFHGDSPRTVLDKKWVLNYFLEQWLTFNNHPPKHINKAVDTLSASRF